MALFWESWKTIYSDNRAGALILFIPAILGFLFLKGANWVLDRIFTWEK